MKCEVATARLINGRRSRRARINTPTSIEYLRVFLSRVGATTKAWGASPRPYRDCRLHRIGIRSLPCPPGFGALHAQDDRGLRPFSAPPSPIKSCFCQSRHMTQIADILLCTRALAVGVVRASPVHPTVERSQSLCCWSSGFSGCWIRDGFPISSQLFG